MEHWEGASDLAWESGCVVIRPTLGKVDKDLRTNLGRREKEGRTSITYQRVAWKGKGVHIVSFYVLDLVSLDVALFLSFVILM